MTSASGELELPADQRRPAASARHRAEAGAPTSDNDAVRGPLIAPLIAWAIVGATFVVSCVLSFTYVKLSDVADWQIALSVGYLLALLALQLFYFSRPGVDLRSPLTYTLLAVQAALAYLPLFEYGEAWIGMPPFLAGTVLLVLRPVLAWSVFAAVIASTAWIEFDITGSRLDLVYVFVANTVVALEVYGLTRLAGLIYELHTARAELANTAVAHERLRFARDLHELLGLSLSAIAPKGELAHRLVARNPERAKQELSEILDVSRRALADVRAVAHGYREINLDEASRSAESVLASSRVDVRMERNHGELPVHVRTLLAAVLREGVSNVLEHSDAERCDISVRQTGDRVTLDIVNDGVDERLASSGPYEGSRLTVLSQRVAAEGGTLTAGIDEDRRYRLHMTVPVTAPVADAAEAAEPEQIPQTKARLARALMVAVFAGTGLISALRLAFLTELHTELLQYMVSVGYLVMLLAIQLVYFSRPNTRLRSPTSYSLLLVQACLVNLPLLQFGVAWQALPGFLAGSALLVLPPILGWLAFAAVVASAGLLQILNDQGAIPTVFSMEAVVISGLVVFGLTWMVRSMTELRAARIQLAQVAVAEERLRFARDLHDLLGLSLSAITLKSELAHRLVTAAPDKAREELTEILAISRLALADVRLVASGYRDLSLDEEFRTAESLLAAADVDVQLDLKVGELPDQVGTLLATVLREGVTNVLRHSKGERCEITVEQQNHMVYLDIVNDGVAQAPARRSNGSGISNLSYRVALFGGELTAGLQPDGRFRLRAKVPA